MRLFFRVLFPFVISTVLVTGAGLSESSADTEETCKLEAEQKQKQEKHHVLSEQRLGTVVGTSQASLFLPGHPPPRPWSFSSPFSSSFSFSLPSVLKMAAAALRASSTTIVTRRGAAVPALAARARPAARSVFFFLQREEQQWRRWDWRRCKKEQGALRSHRHLFLSLSLSAPQSTPGQPRERRLRRARSRAGNARPS